MANTPTRQAGRISDADWNPFVARVEARGETITGAIRRAIRRYPPESYRAEVYRDGKWWMIRVPELNLTTQARNESEVWLMAREAIAVWLDIDTNTVNVELVILPTAKETEE